MNPWDVVLTIAIAAALSAAIISCIKQRKNKNSCGGDCGSCRCCSLNQEKKS